IVRCFIASNDHPYLELQLYQIRIKAIEEYIVDELSVKFLELKVVVMISKLNTRFARQLANLVCLLRSTLPVVQRCTSRQSRRRDDHLCQTEFFRKIDSLLRVIS